MPDVVLTWEQLISLLDDFREWYEFTWMSESIDIDDHGMSAPNYYVWWKKQDPCWPDRPLDTTS